MNGPLKYKIRNWHQLSNCQSNNSRDLRIEVSDYIQNPRMEGTRIAVKDKQLGTLFSCIVNAHGPLVTPSSIAPVYEFTPAQILSELRKFGFEVEYYPGEELPGAQIEYLMTLNQLGMDKIRVLGVSYRDPITGKSITRKQIVCFVAIINPTWLINTFVATEDQFTAALNNGSAINLTEISETKHFDWTWLQTFVANIDDILTANAEVISCQ